MSTPLLQLESLVKRFGGLTATDHASLSVMPGEVHALIGPNGAGKTTLIHQISGAMASDEGTLRFNGTDITHLPMHERVLAGLARSLNALSPLATLERGYAIAFDAQGRTVQSIQQVNVDDTLRVRVRDGEIAAKVTSTGGFEALPCQ